MYQTMKPLRFGIFSHNTTPSIARLAAQARRTEELGYASFLIPDHIGDVFAPALALAHVAHATRSLHAGSFVFCNDFRHPVLLAKDALTLNLLSGGRFELGLGAGWMESEYEQCGLEFASPGMASLTSLSGMNSWSHWPLSLLAWRGSKTPYESAGSSQQADSALSFSLKSLSLLQMV